MDSSLLIHMKPSRTEHAHLQDIVCMILSLILDIVLCMLMIETLVNVTSPVPFSISMNSYFDDLK